MDSTERQLLRAEVDALIRDVETERYRHVAGLEGAPVLGPLFQAHHRAAHRDTVAALRADGDEALASVVGALRTERVAAAHEERWRAADSEARALGPDGPVALDDAALAIDRERDPVRRAGFGRALADGFASAASPRERWAEARAQSRAEQGVVADWEQVVAADALLAASDDPYRDVLGWLSRSAGDAASVPQGGLERAGLLHLLALHPWDGVFRKALLAPTVDRLARTLRLDLSRVRVDAAARARQWPGAHVFGDRVSFRPRGGAPDWIDLLGAVGSALAAAAGPPPGARDATWTAAVGALLSGLLADRAFLVQRLDVEKKHAADVARVVALRQLFRLRAAAAALRVAVEVERGTSGAAWRSAHRDALTLAALAAWPEGLHARDSDPAPHAAALTGAAAAARVRAFLVDRYDEDWWRNPRAAEALAGMLAAGAAPFAERAAVPEGAAGLVTAMT